MLKEGNVNKTMYSEVSPEGQGLKAIKNNAEMQLRAKTSKGNFNTKFNWQICDFKYRTRCTKYVDGSET